LNGSKKIELADGISFTVKEVDSALNSSEIIPEEWVDFMQFLISDWEGITETDANPNSPTDSSLPFSALNCAELFSHREFDQLLYQIIVTSFSQSNAGIFDWEQVFSYACDIYAAKLNNFTTNGAFNRLRSIIAQYNNPAGVEEKQQIEPHYGSPYYVLGNEHISFFEILRESRAIQGGFGVIYNSVHISEFIDYYIKVIQSGNSFTARLDSVWGINRYLLLMRRLDSIYVNFQHEEAEKRRKDK
jgi:hypothetical protein